MAAFTSAHANATHDLTSLITASPSASPNSSAPATKVYPNDDTIISLLHARSRIEQPCTRVGKSGTEYVLVNPLRVLGSLGEETRQGYQRDTEGTERTEERQPSIYELAGRVWLLMSRTKESQSVVYHGVTGAGKTASSRHFTSQVLHLASHNKAQRRIADQINYLLTVLDAFGNSKSPLNPSASQHGRLFELHFTERGDVVGAKVLPFGLNKSKLGKLHHDERSFHIFYQMLAGASPDERDALNLDEPSSYALLASSGCYVLPGGPFSDDSAQLSELRAALASLGFKAKHVRAILTLLIAILLLSNLTFTDDRQAGSLGMSSIDEKARAEDPQLLAVIAAHLGVASEELEKVLVNRTKWVRRDLCSMFLDAKGAAEQRDSLMRDLYAILFTFVVEMANKRLAPAQESELQITQLDLPGYQSRTAISEPSARPTSLLSYGPLVQASGQNGFDELQINFMNELVQSYVTRRAFDDDQLTSSSLKADGLRLPAVVMMGNAACVELLRGGVLGTRNFDMKPKGLVGLLASASEELKGEERADEKAEIVIERLTTQIGRHASFVVSPQAGLGPLPVERHLFGVNHWSGQCTYDATDLVDRNADVLDKQLVDLLRQSSDSFVAKLVSGPGLATEGHPLDENITVEAQVSVTPLRTPSAIPRPSAGQDTVEEAEWPIDASVPQPVLSQLNATLSSIFGHLDHTRIWTVACIRPNDSAQPNSFDKRRVKAQVRSLLLPDLVNRRQIDYVAHYSLIEFCMRHGLGRQEPTDAVRAFSEARGWAEGVDFAIGQQHVWLCWDTWKEQEDLIRSAEGQRGSGDETLAEDLETLPTEDQHQSTARLVSGREISEYDPAVASPGLEPYSAGTPQDHYQGYRDSPEPGASTVWSEYKNEEGHPTSDLPLSKETDDMIVKDRKHTSTEIIATTRARRAWIRITWALTWWIPSFLLRKIGGMKRADVRMAWREKLAICIMILFACATVLFYIIVFGKLLCPDSDKAWNPTELSEHAGDDDYYAAIAGKVYDFTTFYKGQHSDDSSYPTSSDVMLEFAGQDLTDYFPPPMTVACPGLVTSDQLSLQRANFTPVVAYAVHTSGALYTGNSASLKQGDWYTNTLQPALQQYYKGYFVYTKGVVESGYESDSRNWAIYKKKVYDLTDYLYTVDYYSSSSGTDLPNYSFLNSDITTLFSASAGQDITSSMQKVLNGMSTDDVDKTMQCLNSAFYVGELDFRETPRCTVQNYLLLAFSIVIMATIASKFLAALQLGSKRYPEQLDKFVICQVPCYTEGEESLKKTIDSLAELKYDDKRKLIFIICDGNIIGSGNNRPTPRIVLDILGVDPKLDPEPLLFKSIGEGSKQLNYAKVYSGLYEYESHVVPYVVVVKVGKPTETSKPGNRGKRDSQVMLLQYLNRVHFDAPMSPLELEIYHQMRNVIGVDPTFYEYIFQVDADTTVMPESLNRLISCAADDSRIIGICGETKVANERESLTTMIQVYEYYISHHLTKAFESLFGAVTCLPGCFSVYRIRTADKGRPVIISSIVIDEYAEPNVDTLHKKNLFSLGEDRYLTTLMMKHFSEFRLKFTPDAIAHTVAPSRWGVLLSQRRRWINSTIHNLSELLLLKDMCGVCCLSMRWVVFLDLLGTIILPATCAYLVYLVIVVSTGKSAIPVISLAMIGAVYGLQALIFIIKREFMLVGWMVVYIAAFPIYSVFLPLYAFWSMDDFSWGNTRKVVGEGNQKTVVYEDDEPFHDSMIPYKTFKEYEANAWETTSQHSERSRESAHTSVSRNTHRSRIRPRAGKAESVHSDVPPGGDYWRDGSPLGPSHTSRNLRGQASVSSLRQSTTYPYPPAPNSFDGRLPSMAGLSMWGPGSVYGPPGPPTQSGFLQPMHTGMSMPMNPFDSTPNLAFPNQGYPPYPNNGSPHMGIGASLAPRNSSISLGMPQFPPAQQTRMSSFSVATTANPLGSGAPPVPSSNPSPSDDEVLGVLRRYLASQDLMSVTKRQTREALFGLFPQAGLDARAGWVNENIDKILSES